LGKLLTPAKRTPLWTAEELRLEPFCHRFGGRGKRIRQEPTLSGFASRCVVPFLYAVSKRLLDGEDFVFSELAHGKEGILEDYLDLLALVNLDQVSYAIELLGTKRRVANKKNCPCGCGKRLGECGYHRKLNVFRNLAPRSWFLLHLQSLKT